MSINVQHLETSAEHFGNAVESILKGLFHFLAVNTPALTQAAEVAETLTGNAALIPTTETVAKAVETGSTLLDGLKFQGTVPVETDSKVQD